MRLDLPVTLFFLFAAAAHARDLTLAEAEKMMEARNRELQPSRRAVESAEAQRVIAAARPNPIVSMNSTDISNDPGTGSGSLSQKKIDTVFRIDQVFERGGKRELRMGAADDAQLAARSDVHEAMRQQLAQLRGAYYDLKQAEEKVAVLGETAQLFSRTLTAAQARLKAGDLAVAEVAKVQLDYERAQNDSAAAQGELRRARIALAYLIGEEGAPQALRAADPWPERSRAHLLDPEPPIEMRPDVVAARARVEVAEKMRDLARSQRTRDLTLGAQYEHYPGSVPVHSIGFGVSFPLFLGNDFSGDIQKAEVERNAALDALDRARAIAVTEVRRTETDLATAVERLERYETTLLLAAQRTADAAEFSFQRGASSVLEVLDARRTLRAVQLEALAARTDHAKALAAWRASRTVAEPK